MIKLKSPLNYRGTLIEAGTAIGFLPVAMQEKLIKNGAAERVVPEEAPEKQEKPIEKMTKDELLELAVSLQIEGVTDKMTKAEILEAIAAHQQKSVE